MLQGSQASQACECNCSEEQSDFDEHQSKWTAVAQVVRKAQAHVEIPESCGSLRVLMSLMLTNGADFLNCTDPGVPDVALPALLLAFYSLH